MRKLILAAALLLIGNSAFAQLDPVNATNLLRLEANRLDQSVMSSILGPQVRNATYNLARSSDMLYRCVIGRTGTVRPPERPTQPGRPPQPGRQPFAICSQDAMRTQNFFRVAEQLLWNTQATAPQVHYQFLRTSQAHRNAQIAVSQASGVLRSSGRMNRVPYNFQGRVPTEILNRCLGWAQGQGLNVVYELTINGRVIPAGGGIGIRQACQYVATYAIPGLAFDEVAQ